MSVRTLDIKGKAYVTVAERVRLVHSERETFDIIESAPFEVAGRWLWRSAVSVDGRQYIGNAEVKLNAAKNLPDGTNPFECAETSAIGRALGFAGLGSVDSIASAEEVIRAMAELPDASKPSYDENQPATEQQIATINRLQERLDLPFLPVHGLSFQEASVLIKDLSKQLQAKRRAS